MPNPTQQAEIPTSSPAGGHELRMERRNTADCSVELTWRGEAGDKRLELCRAVDISEAGVGVESSEPLPPCSHVVVRAQEFEIAALAKVTHCSWRRSIYFLGLQFVARTSTGAADGRGPDHYEILRLGNEAGYENIERVYRTLAKRYHPDNEETGDAEIFLRIYEAHRILSDPDRRERYDRERNNQKSVARFEFGSGDFFGGLKGEQNRRLAVLCLLYRKKAVDLDSPGLTMLDLEGLSGLTREELGFGLWYLAEKRFAVVGDDSKYRITSQGVDHVEGRVGREFAELSAIATAQIPARQLQIAR